MDDILPIVGEFGTYQKLMLWLVCLPACFPCGFGAFNQLFMADVPKHWCRVPQLENITTIEQMRNLSIPFENGEYAECKRYAVDWYELVQEENENSGPLICTSYVLERVADVLKISLRPWDVRD
ncbi:unnamed protein product [Acanthoscelides obtectus]|uniref:Uncharacterized protein n=1 Tax=Acanthoscelides obtectus TaxID=200917 RepID=A0A9P0LUQ2_ACAOB|nr:unnamed protein product [Acanthoscelides obtectus]CAK1648570.1 Carcinine transporter [Acanthoscelides obtectus]